MTKIFTLVLALSTIWCSLSQTITFSDGSTSYTCGGSFYDSGGALGNYPNSQNGVHVICSDTPNKCLRITINNWIIEPGYDYLNIYDGTNTSGQLVASLDGASGSANDFSINSSTGCFTFEFYSDNIYNYGGWDISLACIDCADPLSNCTTTSQGTIGLLECSDIGTNAFNEDIAIYNTSNVNTLVTNGPTPASSCGGSVDGANYGSWNVFYPEPGVDAISISLNSSWISYPAFNPSIEAMWTTIYQGNDCGTLTEVFCDITEIVDSYYYYDWFWGLWLPTYDSYLYDHYITGIDDSQPIYIYTSYSSQYWTITNLEVTGFQEALNNVCADAGETNEGCNVGASADDTWSGPTANGESCTGGTWYSNENTVYYSFTATESNATLNIENAICNNGTNGEIQIGVWEDCASVGNYGVGSGFVGCAVGSGTLSMPSLTVGETYILVADGQAGDLCTWDFITNGIVLPVELINLKAQRLREHNLIYWSTASEYYSDYFIIERSLDGYTFEEIGKIDAAGTTNELTNYEFKDFDQKNHTVYYRLKQFDKDGNFEYHGPRPVYYSGNEGFEIAPNPTDNKSWLTFEFDANSDYAVHVLDLSGREIVKKEINTTAIGLKGIELGTESFEAGVYLVYLIENGVLKGTKELIKK